MQLAATHITPSGLVENDANHATMNDAVVAAHAPPEMNDNDRLALVLARKYHRRNGKHSRASQRTTRQRVLGLLRLELCVRSSGVPAILGLELLDDRQLVQGRLKLARVNASASALAMMRRRSRPRREEVRHIEREEAAGQVRSRKAEQNRR